MRTRISWGQRWTKEDAALLDDDDEVGQTWAQRAARLGTGRSASAVQKHWAQVNGNKRKTRPRKGKARPPPEPEPFGPTRA